MHCLSQDLFTIPDILAWSDTLAGDSVSRTTQITDLLMFPREKYREAKQIFTTYIPKEIRGAHH